MNLIHAVESIPGGIEGSEFDMGDVRQNGRFFSKKEIKWFRSMAKAEHHNLLTAELWGLFFGHKETKEESFWGKMLAGLTSM